MENNVYSFSTAKGEYKFVKGDQIVHIDPNHRTFAKNDILTFVSHNAGQAPTFKSEAGLADIVHVKDLNKWKPISELYSFTQWSEQVRVIELQMTELQKNLEFIKKAKPKFQLHSDGMYPLIINGYKLDVPGGNYKYMQEMGLMRSTQEDAIQDGVYIGKFIKLISVISQVQKALNDDSVKNYAIYIDDDGTWYPDHITSDLAAEKDILPLMTEKETIMICDLLNSGEVYDV